MPLDFWDVVTIPNAEDLKQTITANGRSTNPQGTQTDGFVNGAALVVSPEGFKIAPNVWDTVWLFGRPLPGLCGVRAEPGVRVDRKAAGGRDAENVTILGYAPARIDIEVTLWTPEHWSTFLYLLPFFWSKANKAKKPDAIPISHPALDMLGIGMCKVTAVAAPETGSIVGTKVIAIRALEFVSEQTKNLGTVKAAAVPPAQQLQRNNSPPAPSQNGGFPTGPAPNARGGSQ